MPARSLCALAWKKKIHGHDSEREQHKAKGLEFLDSAALDLLMVNDI